MAKPQVSINVPQKGLNREQYNLGEADYSTLLNGLFEATDTGTFTLTNEMSNLLSSRFKEGFVVLHAVNDITSNNTYFFLVNQYTGVGEFGVIENIQNVTNIEDIPSDCEGCLPYLEVAQPLEEVSQVELNTYQTLLTDECHIQNNQPELGFMFDINFPIRKSVIKNEKCGKILYFVTFDNSPRYINLSNLGQYLFTGDILCGDDQTVPTCLAADKLLIFRKYNLPTITPTSIELGGRLKLGVYEFLVSYCDQEGNEISEYTSITNPIKIFDENNVIYTQSELSTPTNFGIKLTLNNLDKRYHFYKIVVIQTTLDSVATPQFFEEGIHNINDTTIFYQGDQHKKPTDLNSIIRENIYVDKVALLTEASNSLVMGDLVLEKEINLQPIANLLGSFLKWQTHIASEDLYKNGVSSSLYVGYNRDEVVPFSIRFLLDGGFKTAVFPLIARMPASEDLIEVSSENLDRASIEANIQACNGTSRTQTWQFYNTATEDGFCEGENIVTIEVVEPETKVCYIEDIAEYPSGNFTIELSEQFTTFLEYVEDNRENCPEAFGTSDLCEYLDITNYAGQDCVDGLFGVNCQDTNLDSENIEITEVQGQGVDGGILFEGTEKIFPDEYSKIRTPQTCNFYKLDPATGDYDYDIEFQTLYMWESDTFGHRYSRAIKREYNFYNEDCAYSDDIQNVTNANSLTLQGYFHNYVGATTLPELKTSKEAIAITTNFTDKIHKGALWFKGYTNNRPSFILEVSKQNTLKRIDDIISSGTNIAQEVRVSLFSKCSSTIAFYSEIFSIKSTGLQLRIDTTSTGITINNGTSVTTLTGTGFFPNGDFYVVVDNPIYEVQGRDTYTEGDNILIGTIVTKYRTAPTNGCYSIATRNIEYSSATISWDLIKFRKKQVYTSNCTYEQPIVQACKAIPYKNGKFGYWQSEETYPDNQELFNSKNLLINQNDIPSEYRTYFEDNFVDDIDGSTYVLSDNANFSCKNIKHFRFPDNAVSPFMYENNQAPYSNSIIYPLGITIDENVINTFLDIAVRSGLISQNKRDLIKSYEIFRGDISQDRSIVSSGLLYDMKKYTENKNDVHYSNYPYNDLGDDRLNYKDANRTEFIHHPFDGEKNNKFTFHSPETDYFRPTLPSELSVQGYMFGQSRGNFNKVKNHSKWVILTSKAKDLANILAGLEVASEIAIQIALAGESFRVGFWAGTSSGSDLNPVGAGLATAAAALQAVNDLITKFGRYRYEWIKTFRDLGHPEIFANYYYSEGKYNYLKAIQDQGNKIRGINTAKYLKEGRAIFPNEVTGKKVSINNIDREKSVFIDLGDGLEITYPVEYTNYDNNSVSFNNSSLTFASENGECTNGKSGEIKRNIASPYVAIKNFLPSQYGTLNSVNWLSTSYRGDLKNPQSGCLPIFGGDTYISRHTLKRKMPLFFDSSFGLADLTPFDYKTYANIGREPRFFVNYEVNTNQSIGSYLFPDIDYSLAFDCSKRDGNYYSAQSKFYLYYYGVPSFLTESRINTNFRTAEPTPTGEKDFYPNFADLDEWTQEKNNSIKKPNYFFYNSIYSKNVTEVAYKKLLDTYSKVEADCRNDKPNGIMWSLPDNSENNYSDPWLIFKPLNFYEFETKNGRLKDLRTIEREQILVRQEHATSLFNAIDTTIDDGKKPETKNLLSAFARRPLTYSETDLGYGGTQSTQSVSCEFGHFHADVKRGQVVQIPPGGQGIEEISAFINGKPSGMKNWFKNNFPFKILKQNIPGIQDLDTDNAINGVGITMGYDNRFKRVFITKKDYVPQDWLPDFVSFSYENGRMFIVIDGEGQYEIDVFDPFLFKDVGWTVAYSPVEQKWIGWYSYKPNYYISHQDYFQIGFNANNSDFGLWSHLLTNKSYQVFQGTRYPFLVEYMLKREYGDLLLKTVGMDLEVYRYHNEFDMAIVEDKPFNKMWIYSPHTNSGELHLKYNTGQLSLISQYPKTANDGTYQEILITKNNNEYTSNYFYNRILTHKANQPAWYWDENQIDKTLNTQLVRFAGKTVLEPMRSNTFTVRLQQDLYSSYRYILNLTASKTNLSQ